VAESRRNAVKQIGRLISSLKSRSFQQNPYLPDLLHQPSFLIAPELGRLVAVFLFAPDTMSTWRSTLAAVEDLFEVKQFCGEFTSVIGLINAQAYGASDQNQRRFQLLQGLFDAFDFIDIGVEERQLQSQLHQAISTTVAKQNLYPLWKSERNRVNVNLKHFLEGRFESFVALDRRRAIRRKAIVQEIQHHLERDNIAVDSQVRVRTAKEPIAGLQERNAFIFPLAAHPIGSDSIVPIDIISAERYGSRTKLRYLMAKARFVNYVAHDDRIEPNFGTPRPVLFVDGNLAGPSHDPYRYVRALVSVGWRLTNDFNAIAGALNANI
jgi:hypothetical protein